MKQEAKSQLARQRIIDAAMREFAVRGYAGASLNAACAENGISKGIVYHHFKDKDELYLLCVERCFGAMTAYLKEASADASGTTEQRLRRYFDGRLGFFAQNPLYLGIFVDALFQAPEPISQEVARRRRELDGFNLELLTSLLEGRHLRGGLSPQLIAEDFKMYIDFFNVSFHNALHQGDPPEQVLGEHEDRCHRQIDILLHGVLGDEDET